MNRKVFGRGRFVYVKTINIDYARVFSIVRRGPRMDTPGLFKITVDVHYFHAEIGRFRAPNVVYGTAFTVGPNMCTRRAGNPNLSTPRILGRVSYSARLSLRRRVHKRDKFAVLKKRTFFFPEKIANNSKTRKIGTFERSYVRTLRYSVNSFSSLPRNKNPEIKITFFVRRDGIYFLGEWVINARRS